MITSITWVALELWGLVLVGMGTTSFHCGPASLEEGLCRAGIGGRLTPAGDAEV